MENPKSKAETMRLSISIHPEDDARVLRLKHHYEKQLNRRVTVSEVARIAFESLEEQLGIVLAATN